MDNDRPAAITAAVVMDVNHRTGPIAAPITSAVVVNNNGLLPIVNRLRAVAARQQRGYQSRRGKPRASVQVSSHRFVSFIMEVGTGSLPAAPSVPQATVKP